MKKSISDLTPLFVLILLFLISVPVLAADGFYMVSMFEDGRATLLDVPEPMSEAACNAKAKAATTKLNALFNGKRKFTAGCASLLDPTSDRINFDPDREGIFSVVLFMPGDATIVNNDSYSSAASCQMAADKFATNLREGLQADHPDAELPPIGTFCAHLCSSTPTCVAANTQASK